MKSTASYSLWRVAVVLVLALGFTPRSEMQAQDSKAHQPQSKSTPAPAAKSSRGPQEGIKVHGHWVIEVRNPDGRLDKRYEFKNALEPTGAHLLARLLKGELGVNAWQIAFDVFGGSGARPCTGGSGPSFCVINVPGIGDFGQPTVFFPNLTVDVPTSGPNSGLLVLSGNATATNPQASHIEFVQTNLWACPSSASPILPCGGASVRETFTRRTFSPAIQIAPGQIIQVTVTFSFS